MSLMCPHCNTKAQFNLMFPEIDWRNKDETLSNVEKASWEIGTGTFKYSYYIWKCQVCSKLVFRAHEKSIYKPGATLIGQFPSIIRLDSKFEDLVPKEILEDFLSAIKCFEFQEFRPASAMCRRSLQSSVLEQGASENKDLFDQIDELNEKSPDRFTSDIKDWAHNIRIFGNWGAHPDTDGLKDVDEDIAKEVIDFLKSYFHYVYVMPKKVADSRLRKSSLGSSSK